MDVLTALGLVVLGGLLGMAGQGARVIVGLRKDSSAAANDPRLKELADREDELHRKVMQLVDQERDLGKTLGKALERAESAPDDTQAAIALTKIRNDIAQVSTIKRDAVDEKGMILRQRQASSWFHPAELLVSLLIAFVVGGIAGILAGVQLIEEEITQSTMLTIVAAGYAGTDFIEGFISERLPK